MDLTNTIANGYFKIADSDRAMKEDTVEEEDVESSLTDHEIDVEDIDDGDDGHHLTGKSGGAVLQRHRHQGSHSTIRSFKEEEEDDEDEVLDKEEIVDEDDVGGPPVGAVKSKKKSGKKSGKSSGSGSSGSSSSSNPQIKPKCNCEQLQLVDCHLETKELWDKFNELGTEMIITKTGRLVIVVPAIHQYAKPRSIPFTQTKTKERQTFHINLVGVSPTNISPLHPSHESHNPICSSAQKRHRFIETDAEWSANIRSIKMSLWKPNKPE